MSRFESDCHRIRARRENCRDCREPTFSPNGRGDAVRQLRLVDRNDPVVTMVAKTIIELARRGERDPIRLRDQAIQSFR